MLLKMFRLQKMNDPKKRSSVHISEIIEGGNILVSLSERVLGRVIAENIKISYWRNNNKKRQIN